MHMQALKLCIHVYALSELEALTEEEKARHCTERHIFPNMGRERGNRLEGDGQLVRLSQSVSRNLSQ